jgi:hypothetical protein
MNLSFDSIDDLKQFLHWADKYSSGQELTLRLPADALKFPTLDTGEDTASAGIETKVYTDGTTATGPAPLPEQSPAQQAAGTPEPTKRKRRTKAEIEADEKAAQEAAAELAKAQQTGQVQPEGTQGANPFDQPANAAAAPAEGAETLNGDKKPEPAADEGGETVVTPFQHITRGREFIGKHGMVKYNETFALAGVPVDVMGHTAYQRALHVAAMDEMEKT